MTSPPDDIFVDARPLQDVRFRLRGVGQHSVSLLQAMRQHEWRSKPPRFVAVLDAAQEDLLPEHRPLFDAVERVAHVEPVRHRRDAGLRHWFLSLSPMTHDPTWVAPLLVDDALYRLAIFHDLIPLELPDRYLAAPDARADYIVCLAWLSRFDAFAANSRRTATQLATLMNVEPGRIFVTGVALRPSLMRGRSPRQHDDRPRRHFIVAGGGDPRKNVECALSAHAGSASLARAGIGIAVFGAYDQARRDALYEYYLAEGGAADNLEVRAELSDDELLTDYATAVATIVPSVNEGFSIPVIESSLAGTPVLASDIPAHAELVPTDEWRFAPDDPEQLRGLMERVASGEGDWRLLQESQAELWTHFTTESVGARFLEGAFARMPDRIAQPSVVRGARPSLAVLTPLPPAQSGVSDYTAVTLLPLKQVADLHMYTPTPNARWEEGWASLAPVAAARFAAKPFDATLGVVGNSHHHTEIVDFVLDQGGACVAHDARMSDFYVHVRGMPQARRLASRELGRAVSDEEIGHWLGNPRDLPTLFLSEIAKVASPLLVHSPVTADIIDERYGVKPILLPFAQYRYLPIDSFTPSARAESRQSLGIGPKTCLVATFGGVGTDRALEDMLWTVKMLRNWSVDAHLAFCGYASSGIANYLRAVADALGISDNVTIFETYVSEQQYRTYLAAADVGIQLRKYFLGGLSGALNDCIAAALPTVANDHLARAMMTPAFVRRVPDNLSAVLIAEAVMEVLEARENVERPLEACAEFRTTHSPAAYCRRLVEALGLEVTIPDEAQA